MITAVTTTSKDPLFFEITPEILGRMKLDPIYFCNSFGIYPYWYQEEILWDDAQDIVISMGRQIGKTYAVALKAIHAAFTKPKVVNPTDPYVVMIIAPAQRQSKIMFKAVRDILSSHPILFQNVEKMIQEEIVLKNGSIIYNFPIGESAERVRGFTINMLIADEAAYIKSNAFDALIPSLGATDGVIILISTPKERGGHFYHAIKNSITYEDWMKAGKKLDYDGQYVSHWYPYTVALEVITRDRKGKFTGKTQLSEGRVRSAQRTYHPSKFAQEYRAQFVDDSAMFFSRELIVNATEDYAIKFRPEEYCDYYMGVDFAKVHDYYIAVVLEKPHDPDYTPFKLVHWQQSRKVDYSVTVPETARTAKMFRVKTLYCDDTGVGKPNVEKLQELLAGISRVEGISMTSIAKQYDLYSNVYEMLGAGKLILPASNQDLINQMLSLTRTKMPNTGRIKIEAIAGAFDDYPDAIALACMAVNEPRWEMFVSSVPSVMGRQSRSRAAKIQRRVGATTVDDEERIDIRPLRRGRSGRSGVHKDRRFR